MMAYYSVLVKDSLTDLIMKDLKEFKWCLIKEFGIKKSKLENADVLDIVTIMEDTFTEINIVPKTIEILKKMKKYQQALDLVNKCKSTRIALLSKDVSESNKVRNFMLEKPHVESEWAPVDHNMERVREKNMTLINCPYLLQPNLSSHQMTQILRECVNLSDPGPHVIVLIIKHDDDYSREDQERVEKVFDCFSDSIYEHTLVLTTHDSSSGVHQTHVHQNIQQFITKCRDRHFRLEANSSLAKLKEELASIVERNSRRYMTCEKSLTMIKKEEDKEVPKLNVVVCGSERTLLDRKLKHSILKGMLNEFSRRSDCVMRIEMEVCGRLIDLLELPALCETSLSDEELMRQILSCLSLCNPGVHVFLLVIPHHPLTDEQKAEIEEIHKTFGSRIKNHIMILIMQESENTTEELDEVTKSVIEHYANRFQLIKSDTQALTLLEKFEQMVIDNSGAAFTTKTFLDEQIKKNTKSEQMTTIHIPENKDEVRIVLLGKTGVGKSATGNTILKREVFTSDISEESVTKVCQRETVQINNRFITIIDTPDLFDIDQRHEEIQREMINCISMIMPGPHVFLLLVPLGRFTTDDATSLKIIQEMFGKNSGMYIMVLFTRGDNLKKKTIEEYLGKPGSQIRNLLKECGNRYHVFNNTETKDHTQVSVLLEKIDHMVKANRGSYYSFKMFRDMERDKQEELMKLLIGRIEVLIREREEQKEEIMMMMEEETKGNKSTVEKCALS